MIPLKNLVASCVTLCILISCSDHSTDSPGQQVRATLNQLKGCQSDLSNNATVSDSCFSYQFAKKLIVDFCLLGNCCPDSDRFSFSCEVRTDTIFVVAVDTAANLCNCLCNYVNHAEFDNLPLDHYVFYCTCSDYGNRVCYIENISRNGGS
jgi:hypothetical protein